MAELPKGVTKEVRRGGSGVLELLLMDFSREVGDGYLRIEQSGPPKSVGQLVITSGSPEMALFEREELLMGKSALEKIRQCATADDSRISVHTDVDFGLISDLHPEAKLHFDKEAEISGKRVTGWIIDTKNDSDWWRSKQKREWTIAENESEQSEVETSELYMEDQILDYSPGEELEVGCSYLVDDQTPDSVMKIASHLAAIGHPLLVISRSPPARLEKDFGIPASLCRWLTEKDDDQILTVNPGLESVRRICDEFLWSSAHSVIVIDGVEYLSGIHGYSRLIGMLRDLFDTIQTSDDIVMIPADLDVWDERERTLLIRECDLISHEKIEEWSMRPSLVEGHAFCQDIGHIPVPEMRTNEFVDKAEDEFKQAASRLLNSAEQARTVSPKPPSQNASGEELQSPNKSTFSAKALIDEMKAEPDDDSIAKISGTNSEVIESTSIGIEEEADSDGLEKGDSDEFQLPSWATAPSANRGNGDEATSTSSGQMGEPALPDNQDSNSLDIQPDWYREVKSEIEQEEGKENSIHNQIEEVESEDNDVDEETISSEEQSELTREPALPQPRNPTINHRPGKKRRIPAPHLPDILEFEKGSMDYAAANSKEVEIELGQPGYEAIERSVTALNSKGDEFRDVGEWVTTEERDWQVLQTDGMGAAVDNARALRHKLKTPTPNSKIHVGQWDEAAQTAAGRGVGISLVEPKENQHARESAARAQRVKTLTQSLASSELKALYADRKQMVKSSGIDFEVISRIEKLANLGHPVTMIVERIEANSKEGVKYLQQMEKLSKHVRQLMTRLNIQEGRSVIDSTVANRYRKSLVKFEQIEEVEALLKDFE